MNSELSTASRVCLWFFVLFLISATWSIAVSQLALGLSLIAFLVVAAGERYNPFAPVFRWLWYAVALWLIWQMVSALAGPTPLKSLLLTREEWLLAIIPIGLYLLRHRRRLNLLVAGLAIGAGVHGLYGVIQYLTGASWFGSYEPVLAPGFGYRVGGALASPVTFGNIFAILTVTVIGLAVAGRDRLAFGMRVVLTVCGVLTGIATLLTFTRSAVVALALGLIVILLLVGRKYALRSAVALATLGIALLLIPGTASRFVGGLERDFDGLYPGGRLFIWQNSLELLEDHPWTGLGRGNFKEHYSQLIRPDLDRLRRVSHAHNDFLHFAVATGIPGALTFLLLWLIALGLIWRGYRLSHDDRAPPESVAALAASICFLAISMFHGTFVDEEVRQVLMFVWALGLLPSYKAGESTASAAGQTP